MSDEQFDAEFFWDPMCPWAWMASRWVKDVVAERGIAVDWRPFALRIVNRDKNYDTEFPVDYEKNHDRSLRLLRVAIPVREHAGAAGVERYYDSVGSMIHDELILDEFDDPAQGKVAEALLRANLPTDLATAEYDEALDAAVEIDTLAGLARVNGDLGTPLITFRPPDGPSIFGPVISRIPPTADASKIWDAVDVLASEPGFSEIKRKRPRRSLFLDGGTSGSSVTQQPVDEPDDACSISTPT
ncbi:MAG: hypothetical protein WBP59_05080 [Ilumatobacteraceae bacterium]